ncbi:MAG: BMP family ABC transporter substrate-binding protein [Chloroflexota bacterium]
MCNLQKVTFLLFSLFTLVGCNLDTSIFGPATATPFAEIPQEPAPTAINRANLTCDSEELLCVGLIVNGSTMFDNSFNQLAYEGLQRAEQDYLAQINFIDTPDPNFMSQNIDQLVEQGYDVIVTVGFSARVTTINAAISNPNVDFIGIDQVQADPLTNLAGLVFPAADAGFLAGVLAGMASETNSVGAVLPSQSIPDAADFADGFELGAKAINPNISVLIEHHPGRIEESLNDPTWGTETTKDLLNNANADAIVGGPGATGSAALIEVAQNSEAVCIGVNTDQWVNVPEARSCLISSVENQIATGVFELIGWSSLSNLPAGNFQGNILLSSFHDFDPFINPQVRSLLREVEMGLRNNTIPLDGSYQVNNPPSISIGR